MQFDSPPWSLAHQFFEEERICSFDFFQAVRLLKLLMKERVLVGEDGPPNLEIVRFHAHLSLSFPPSSIHELQPCPKEEPPRMTVAFMGLTGPSGVLPRPYTERLWTDYRGPEKTALEDWLDLFNHRFISLFYRAWEKYRFYVPFERGKATGPYPDPFAHAMFSLIGLGNRSHRHRFKIAYQEKKGAVSRERVLAELDDEALLRFGGMFAHRPRCAVSLGVFLRVYLGLPVEVMQFQGHWLRMEHDSQTAVGGVGPNNAMGVNTVVGDRTWDVQSKVRLRLGPLTYAQFLEFMPDRSRTPVGKRIFLLAQVVRFYLGAELDADVQLVLKKDEVPPTYMNSRSRLGWNTWSRRKPYPKNADDAVFPAVERPWLR